MPEEINNNKTKVEEIVEFIKTNNLSKDEFKTKFDELQQAMELKYKDVQKDFDKKESDFEAKMESKMVELVESMKTAFPNQNVNHAISQDELKKKFGKDFGEFMVKVRKNDFTNEVKADLAESDGSTGGYLVPEMYSSEILRVNLENSVVRNSNARIINMTGPTLKIPALNVASNAAGSIYGGVAAYWTEENAQVTESEPTFKRIMLEPKKLAGYTESSNELDNDAILSMGNLLSDMFGEVLAFEEDYAFLNGDGVGKPLGITVAPAYITVSRNSGSIVVTADIIDMLSRFKGNLNKAKFIVNQSVLPYIYKLLDENDNYIWHPGQTGSIATSAPGTLYGIPIQVTEKLPAIGTTGDIMLCDFSYYLIGDRMGLSIEESMHYKFRNDQKAWRVTKRVDGQCWLDSAITPRAGGSSLSPFVGLS